MRIFRAVLYAALGLIFAGAASASDAQSDLTDWGIVCFCLHSLHTPQRIMKLDDNGRILYAARDGITQAQLKAEGIAASDSQMALLISWNLLAKSGDSYRTAFPVLDPARMALLRPGIERLAQSIVPRITPAVRELGGLLRQRGFAGSAYAVTFSFVLDGLTWDVLDRNHLLPSSVPTPEHPYWNGALWAFSPKRQGVEGTNEARDGALALQMLWNESVVARMDDLGDAAVPVLKAVAAHRSIPALDVKGMNWQFVDGNGALAIPLIHLKNGDPLYDCGIRIAEKIVSTLNGPDGAPVLASIPNVTRQQAVLIVMHELMWDMIARLTADGTVQRPAVLTGTVPQTPETLRPLIYLVSDN